MVYNYDYRNNGVSPLHPFLFIGFIGVASGLQTEAPHPVVARAAAVRLRPLYEPPAELRRFTQSEASPPAGEAVPRSGAEPVKWRRPAPGAPTPLSPREPLEAEPSSGVECRSDVRGGRRLLAVSGGGAAGAERCRAGDEPVAQVGAAAAEPLAAAAAALHALLGHGYPVAHRGVPQVGAGQQPAVAVQVRASIRRGALRPLISRVAEGLEGTQSKDIVRSNSSGSSINSPLGPAASCGMAANPYAVPLYGGAPVQGYGCAPADLPHYGDMRGASWYPASNDPRWKADT
ncbi:unnamed protein product [Leptosia nina]|uniref:Uncharacterized protein n=1 Tax=Leptosia nina TaxID=320188 RepID=A0AAV1JG87_9NEOP